jgi:hypothetical protein
MAPLDVGASALLRQRGAILRTGVGRGLNPALLPGLPMRGWRRRAGRGDCFSPSKCDGWGIRSWAVDEGWLDRQVCFVT